jgi:hypothetical protein
MAFCSWQPQKNDNDVTFSENGKGYKEAAQKGLVGEFKKTKIILDFTGTSKPRHVPPWLCKRT